MGDTILRLFLQYPTFSDDLTAFQLVIHSGFEYNGFDGSITQNYVLVSAHHVDADLAAIALLPETTVSSDIDDAWTQLTSQPFELATDDTLLAGPFGAIPWTPTLNAAGLAAAQAAKAAGRALKFAVITQEDFLDTGPSTPVNVAEFIPEAEAIIPAPPPPPIPVGPINRTIYADWTGAAPSQENRNWCPEWTTPASSMCLSRRQDGSLAILFGTNDGTGRILRLDNSTRNDDGEAIDAFYQTAFVGGSSGRNTFQYLTSSCAGDGELDISAVLPDGITRLPLKGRELVRAPLRDQEWPGLRILTERVAWRFGTFAVDSWFKLRKLVGYARPAPWSRTLGPPS